MEDNNNNDNGLAFALERLFAPLRKLSRIGRNADEERQMSLDDLAKSVSRETDEFIVKTASEQHLKYVSGKLFIRLTDPIPGQHKSAHLILHGELYFQNEQKSWVKIERKTTTAGVVLTYDSKAELKNKGAVVFTIDPPNSGKP